MELAIVYLLEPPKATETDSPISYKCAECGQSILGYNAEAHAKNFHQTEFYVLKNVVDDQDTTPPVEIPEETDV